jgi:hypothetical protein
MPELPSLQHGFVRIVVHLPPFSALTPGAIARAAGIAPEHIGPIVIEGSEAYVDIAADHGRDARVGLSSIGPTQLIERRWQWLRIAIGRNHGLSMGQLKKILQTADAMPVGRISIHNTHTMIGLIDAKVDAVVKKLDGLKINGFAAKPSALPPGTGPGSPAYVPNGV